MTNATKPKFTTVCSHVAALPVENIDTDQITPARFLKVTSRDGMRDACFADWRSSDADFVLNRAASADAQILLAGHNFGCGSSREHAAWALAAFGFRVVISSSFADIFKSNALKNGIVPLVVAPEILTELFGLVEADVATKFEVDLEALELRAGGKTIGFSVEAFARTCLLRGVDQLGYLVAFADGIAEFEAKHAVYYSPERQA